MSCLDLTKKFEIISEYGPDLFSWPLVIIGWIGIIANGLFALEALFQITIEVPTFHTYYYVWWKFSLSLKQKMIAWPIFHGKLTRALLNNSL